MMRANAMRPAVAAALGVMLLASCDGNVRSFRAAARTGVVGDAAAAEAPASAANDGVVTRRLAAGDELTDIPSISPDGRRLAYYMAATGNVGLLDLATGASRPLTHNSPAYSHGEALDPKFSPDGRWVAYDWEDMTGAPDSSAGAYQLRVVGVDGSPPRVLYDRVGTELIWPADWSPDGRWILTIVVPRDGMRRIMLVSTDGKQTRVLTTLGWRSPGSMRFSPDGRWIYYDVPPTRDSMHRDVYALAVDGSRRDRVVRSAADDRLLGISPDGRHLLFLSDRSGTPAAWRVPVEDGRAAGPPALVKRDLWGTLPMGFTRDGSYAYEVAVSDPTVYVASYDTASGVIGRARPIRLPEAGAVTRPDWSPDGRYLAFSLRRADSGGGSVFVRSVATGALRELPLGPGVTYVRRLRWAADGRSLLVLAPNRKGRMTIERLDAQTGAATTLVERPSDESIGSILPMGGDSVLYKGMAGNREWLGVLHLESGRGRRIYTARTGDISGHSMALSPSGTRLAFTQAVGTPDGLDWKLHILDLTTGRVRDVKAAPHESKDGCVWADEHTLLMAGHDADDASGDASRLYRVDLDTGRFEPTDVRISGLKQIRLSPNRARIAFVGGKRKREVWQMSGLLPEHGGASRR